MKYSLRRDRRDISSLLKPGNLFRKLVKHQSGINIKSILVNVPRGIWMRIGQTNPWDNPHGFAGKWDEKSVDNIALFLQIRDIFHMDGKQIYPGNSSAVFSAKKGTIFSSIANTMVKKNFTNHFNLTNLSLTSMSASTFCSFSWSRKRHFLPRNGIPDGGVYNTIYRIGGRKKFTKWGPR